MKLKNPPPKNARLTKKFAYEVHAVLKELEYRIFMSRILERPANGVDFKWRCDIQDRVTAICAHLYSWREGEKRKAQKRKAQKRTEGGAK